MEENRSRAFINGCPRCHHNGICDTCGRREPRGKLNSTDWLQHIAGDESTNVVEVLFKNTRIGYFDNINHLNLKIGDLVVVEGSPGYDIGRVNLTGHLVALQMKKNGIKDDRELRKVIRLASDEDLDKFEEARAKEHSTMIKARAIAEELGLSMKIGDVEYQGDGGKAIFYYIADERVDFRKLIRILAETFKVRIEMRQIGARQEAGRIGGIGPCGRPLCCATWLNHFVSVGTGAARIQDLSMNPQKLAGQCGKLKCCLNFEIDSYAEAQQELPPKDAVLETLDNQYFLFKSDILGRNLTYSTDKHLPANLVTINAKRAFEIIDLNKKGLKPETLSTEIIETEKPEFGDIIGQDSVTRFDKKNNKKKKKNNSQQPNNNQKPLESANNDSKQQKNRKQNRNRKHFVKNHSAHNNENQS
ncbi:MAG: hypothetical protein J1E82_06465 [Muribaculaceae bacterium]|nr:hypothetical protein [Muribaculaceae bacterium]